MTGQGGQGVTQGAGHVWPLLHFLQNKQEIHHDTGCYECRPRILSIFTLRFPTYFMHRSRHWKLSECSWSMAWHEILHVWPQVRGVSQGLLHPPYFKAAISLGLATSFMLPCFTHFRGSLAPEKREPNIFSIMHEPQIFMPVTVVIAHVTVKTLLLEGSISPSELVHMNLTCWREWAQ